MQFTSRMSGPFTDEQGQSKIAINNVELIDDRYTVQNPPELGVTVFVERTDSRAGYTQVVWRNDKESIISWQNCCLSFGIVHREKQSAREFTQARLMLVLPDTPKQARQAERKALKAEFQLT